MKTMLTLAAALTLAYGSTAAPNTPPASDDTETIVRTAKPRKIKGNAQPVTQDRGKVGAYNALYVSDGIEAIVSATASTLVITANENIIDRVVTRSDGKRLMLRIDARNIKNRPVRAVIPASTVLRTLEAEGASTVRCEVPLGNGPVTVHASEGSRIAADIRTEDDIRMHVSECSRFEGALKGDNCQITVTEGSRTDTRIEASGNCRLVVSSSSRANGSVEALCCALSLTEGSVADMPVTSTGESTLVISSSSRFNGALKSNNCKISVTEGSVFEAPLTCEVHGEIILDASGHFAGDTSAGNSLHIKAANGSVMQGNADADVVLVHATASSHYAGSISAAGQAELKSTDGSIIAGAFAGGHIYAVSTASSRIALTGDTPVPSAVIEVSSGSRFNAPDLPIRNCSVTAKSSGHATVRCTGELLATTSSGGAVSYEGDCRVTTNNPYVRKVD